MTNGINGKAAFYEPTIRGTSIVTANLLFSQAITQTHSPDIERGMTGSSVQNHSAVSKTYAESSGVSRESFLNSLKQISKDLKPNNQTQGGDGEKSSTSSAYNSGYKFAAASHPAAGLEDGISETTQLLEENFDNEESQIALTSNLSAVISILESLGLYDSTEGSSSANRVDGIFGNAESLADFKILIARLGQNDFMKSTEMKVEFDRLQQFMTNAQTGKASSGDDGHHLGEFADSRSAVSSNLNQTMKRIDSGQEDQRGRSGIHMAESDSSEKPSGPNARMNRVVIKLPNDIRQTGSIQSAENSSE